MNNDSLSTISGVYKFEYRWSLFWLNNIETNTEETIKLEKIKDIICFNFDIDVFEKLIDLVMNGEKFLIDFNLKTIKRIKPKEKPFETALYPYFDPDYIQSVIDDYTLEEDIYKKEE